MCVVICCLIAIRGCHLLMILIKHVSFLPGHLLSHHIGICLIHHCRISHNKWLGSIGRNSAFLLLPLVHSVASSVWIFAVGRSRLVLLLFNHILDLSFSFITVHHAVSTNLNNSAASGVGTAVFLRHKNFCAS